MKFAISLKEGERDIFYNEIEKGVLAYNRKYLKNWFPKVFTLCAMGIEDELLGGISGERVDIYIRIDWFWVKETYRNHGIGKNLINCLENYAKEHHVKYIQLDTADFQAKGFYEKLGFEHMGTIKAWVGGYDCHFMQKIL